MSKNNENKLLPKLRFPEFKKQSDWDKKALKNVSEVTMGSSPSSKSYNENKIGLPLLQGNADIKNRLSAPRIYTSEITKECQINDILLSVRAPVGTVAKSLHRACIGRGIAAIRAIDKNSQEYLYQWLISNESAWQNISQGGTFDAVNSDDVRNVLLPIPLPQEQQKIAACLSSLDEVITAESQKLEVLKDHKKGLLQNLLPQAGETVPKFRFKEFENSGEWGEKELGSFCNSLSSGKDKNIEDGEYELYGSTGIIGRAENASYEGDYILVARVGANAGFLNKVKGKFGVTDNTLVINLIKKDIINFIYYSLQNVGLKELVFGSGQPLITGGQLKSLQFRIPPGEKEQEKIADTLSSIDDLISAQNKKMEALQLHKKGLLQGLFPNVNEVTA